MKDYEDEAFDDIEKAQQRKAVIENKKDAALRLAREALKNLFGLPDKFTGKGGDVAVWRLGGSFRAQEAIKAIDEALGDV